MRFFIISSLFLLGIAACEPELNEPNTVYVNQDSIDEVKILEYLEANKLSAKKHPSGLYYTITKEGNGAHPYPASVVTVNYLGYFLDKKNFDGTIKDEPITFYLDGIIEGWIIGIPLLSIGGKGTLYIPSSLGYGSEDFQDIPGNSVLIFDIELVDFK